VHARLFRIDSGMLFIAINLEFFQVFFSIIENRTKAAHITHMITPEDEF
jgi:hypothetical protein